MQSTPNILITIITVTYNAVSVLEKTILSVINQTYDNVEYIIIDGGSTDGTIDLIKTYENRITYWQSEPDKGIYDAMNKGIQKATGQWINFMNAGDYFYSFDVLASVFQKNISLINNADVIYGNTVYENKNYLYLENPLPLTGLDRGMVFCHQSTFVRREVCEKIQFSTEYKISGDYNFFHTLYSNNYIFKYLDIVISVFSLIDSVSVNNIILSQKEDGLINKRYSSLSWKIGFIKLKLHHFIGRIYRSIFRTEEGIVKGSKQQIIIRDNVVWVQNIKS